MNSPHDLFREVMANTGDSIAAIRAIRAIRDRFGLDLNQAKSVMLSVEGIAESVDQHQENIAKLLEDDFQQRNGSE